MSTITVNTPNLRRLLTPGHPGGPRTVQPGDARKYFIVSADEHVKLDAARFFGFGVPASAA